MLGPARSLLLALGLLSVVAFAVRAHTTYRAAVSGDFYQFWVVGQAISTLDVSNPYTPDARRQIGEDFWQRARGGEQPEYAKAARYRRDRLEPAGTPFLYGVFRVLSTGRYERDYEIYRWGSLVAYAFGVIAMARVVGISWPLSLFAVWIVSEWFWPFRIEIAHSNVNQLQIGALGVTALVCDRLSPRRSAAVAGVLLGLLLCFKPNLLYSVALLFGAWGLQRGGLRRDTGRLLPGLAGLGVGAALAFGSAALYFGSPACWSDWVTGSRAILESPDYLWRNLASLAGLGLSPSLLWVAGAALCLPLLVALARSRACEAAPERRGRDLLLLAAGGPVLVLTAPVVHVHYFVLCVPMLIWTFGRAATSALPLALRRGVGAVALALIGGIFGAHFSLWPFLGAALLYGVALAELAWPAAGRAVVGESAVAAPA